jgi:hypothetical protein
MQEVENRHSAQATRNLCVHKVSGVLSSRYNLGKGCNVLSRVWVTVDGGWIGNSIYL